MRKAEKYRIFVRMLAPIFPQRIYFLVSWLKLIDKKSHYHLRSKSDLKFHIWPYTRTKKPGKLSKFGSRTNSQFWSCSNRKTWKIGVMPLILWNLWNFRLDFDLLNDRETSYLPVWAKKLENKYVTRKLEPRFFEKCNIGSFSLAGAARNE
jgi:hypothetical protein